MRLWGALFVVWVLAPVGALAQACPERPSFASPDWAANLDGRRVVDADEARARVDRFTAQLDGAMLGSPAAAAQVRQLGEAHRDVYRATGDAQALRHSVRSLAQSIRDYPESDHIDRVLFLLGWSLGKLGEHDRARQVYHRLISHFPASPYVPAAYLSFGDYYWGERDARAAIRFYQRVVALEAGPTSAYASYMIAWCHRALGEPGQARAAAAAARRTVQGRPHPTSRALGAALRRDACALEP